ncbi:MAG TPA: hypothetical protein VHF22_13515 [Planctomycetota bacterium]|nr:hypothetical protein [Planctomycetota bacterium]
MSFISDLGHSIAHIAQEAVTDIANAETGGLAGIVTNLAKTGLDTFMKDLGGGMEKLGSSLLHAGQDLVKQFSHPGGIHPPKHPKHPAATGGTKSPAQGGVSTPAAPTGYAPLPSAPTQSGDVGVIGSGVENAAAPTWTPVNNTTASPATTSGVKPSSTVMGTGDSELDAILHDPGASVESKIFALLMKLQDKKEKELDGKINELGGKDNPSQADLAELQRVQSQLSELTQLTTNMMKSYKDMKDSIIGNMR